MIGHLFERFRRDLGDAGIGRTGQRRKQMKVPGVEVELPRHRVSVVPVGLLHEDDVAEVPDVALVRQRIRIPSLAFQFSGVSEPELRLADQVQSHIRQGEVFFEHGPMAAPLGQSVRQDQRVVAEPEQILDTWVSLLAHYIAPTSSGMS